MLKQAFPSSMSGCDGVRNILEQEDDPLPSVKWWRSENTAGGDVEQLHLDSFVDRNYDWCIVDEAHE